MREAKILGFSDEQIIRIMQEEDAEVLYERRKKMGLTRVYKMVDTCSAEFEAKTPTFIQHLSHLLLFFLRVKIKHRSWLMKVSPIKMDLATITGRYPL